MFMTEQKDDIIDFTAIIHRISYPFSLLKKHSKLSLVYVAAAVVLAFVLKLTLPPLYSGSFIIKSNENKDLYFLNMLMDLQNLVKDNDHAGIAGELKVQENDAALLKHIGLDAIFNPRGTDSSKAVIVTFEMCEQNRFIELQNALIAYLENSPHYQKLRGIRISNIENLEKKITRDIAEMDSVKRIIIDNIKPAATGGNGLVYNVPVDPYKAYEINMNRYKEQLSLINQQKDQSSFELMKSCVVSKKPIWPKLSVLAFILVPVSLLLFLFHAHRKEKRNLAQ
jgi:hypothetical protein